MYLADLGRTRNAVLEAVRAKGAKGDGTIELYHLTKDPHETKNLAKQNPAKVAHLRKLINAEWDGK